MNHHEENQDQDHEIDHHKKNHDQDHKTDYHEKGHIHHDQNIEKYTF